MITFSNGHQAEYFASSGALAFDGRGWPWEWPLRWSGLLDPSCFTVVVKTLTRQPRRGNLRWWNPLRAVRILRGGVVNTVGLTNPGIDWWCESIGPRVARMSHGLVGSILGESLEDTEYMAARLGEFPLKAIELNVSCPNVAHEQSSDDIARVVRLAQVVRDASQLPVILKLSVTHDYCAIVQRAAGVIEAVSLNTIPWALQFPDAQSPLQRFGGGGVSGRVAQPLYTKMIQELVKASEVPVIGPGVWTFDDIARLRQEGASAIGFGSIFLRYPWRPTAYVKRDRLERGASASIAG